MRDALIYKYDFKRCGCHGELGGEVPGKGWVGLCLKWGRQVEREGRESCITDEIGAKRQLQYICLILTHVAFDFQCEVQKSFIMTQLLSDACACVCVFWGKCVCDFSFVEGGVEERRVAKGVSRVRTGI